MSSHACNNVECSAYALRELKRFGVHQEDRALPASLADATIAELFAHSIYEGASVANLGFEIGNLLSVLNHLISADEPDGPKRHLIELVTHKFSMMNVIVSRLEAVAHDATLTCADSQLHKNERELARLCDAE